MLTIEDHGFSTDHGFSIDNDLADLALAYSGNPVAVMMGIAEYEEMGGRCEGGVITAKEQLAQIVKNLEE